MDNGFTNVAAISVERVDFILHKGLKQAFGLYL